MIPMVFCFTQTRGVLSFKLSQVVRFLELTVFDRFPLDLNLPISSPQCYR